MKRKPWYAVLKMDLVLPGERACPAPKLGEVQPAVTFAHDQPMPMRQWAIKKVGWRSESLPNDSENKREKKLQHQQTLLIYIWVSLGDD
ncbi:hypothetical protein NPIL_324751 [Nephila pilipes]|uniref:Uncharacterized protein n=1 Tax=Nephila pilipes TaxID=299642 RepID=A0A8X6Q811_NEPPI|nr:hypothetical protein NPIL_324751 [Nephila pilipes]